MQGRRNSLDTLFEEVDERDVTDPDAEITEPFSETHGLQEIPSCQASARQSQSPVGAT